MNQNATAPLEEMHDIFREMRNLLNTTLDGKPVRAEDLHI